MLLRHVGAYEDDGGQAIEAFTTCDANIRIDAGSLFGEASRAAITFGAVNIAGAAPPYVNIAGSYDPRSADPRGRRVFLRLTLRFRGTGGSSFEAE